MRVVLAVEPAHPFWLGIAGLVDGPWPALDDVALDDRARGALKLAEKLDYGDHLASVTCSARLALSLFDAHEEWAVGIADLEADQGRDAAWRALALAALAWTLFEGAPEARAAGLRACPSGRALLACFASVEVGLAFTAMGELPAEQRPGELAFTWGDAAGDALAAICDAATVAGARQVLAVWMPELEAAALAASELAGALAAAVRGALPSAGGSRAELQAEAAGLPIYGLLTARLVADLSGIGAAAAPTASAADEAAIELAERRELLRLSLQRQLDAARTARDTTRGAQSPIDEERASLAERRRDLDARSETHHQARATAEARRAELRAAHAVAAAPLSGPTPAALIPTLETATAALATSEATEVACLLELGAARVAADASEAELGAAVVHRQLALDERTSCAAAIALAELALGTIRDELARQAASAGLAVERAAVAEARRDALLAALAAARDRARQLAEAARTERPALSVLGATRRRLQAEIERIAAARAALDGARDPAARANADARVVELRASAAAARAALAAQEAALAALLAAPTEAPPVPTPEDSDLPGLSAAQAEAVALLSAANAEVEAVREGVAEARARLASLDAVAAAERQRAASGERAGARARIEAELLAARARQSNLQAELDAARVSLAAIPAGRRMHAARRTENAGARPRILAARPKMMQAAGQARTARDKVLRRRDERLRPATVAAETFDRLDARLAEIEAALGAAQESRAALEAEVSEARNARMEAQSEQSTASAAITAARASIETCRRGIAEVQRQQDALAARRRAEANARAAARARVLVALDDRRARRARLDQDLAASEAGLLSVAERRQIRADRTLTRAEAEVQTRVAQGAATAALLQARTEAHARQLRHGALGGLIEAALVAVNEAESDDTALWLDAARAAEAEAELLLQEVLDLAAPDAALQHERRQGLASARIALLQTLRTTLAIVRNEAAGAWASVELARADEPAVLARRAAWRARFDAHQSARLSLELVRLPQQDNVAQARATLNASRARREALAALIATASAAAEAAQALQLELSAARATQAAAIEALLAAQVEARVELETATEAAAALMESTLTAELGHAEAKAALDAWIYEHDAGRRRAEARAALTLQLNPVLERRRELRVALDDASSRLPSRQQDRAQLEAEIADVAFDHGEAEALVAALRPEVDRVRAGLAQQRAARATAAQALESSTQRMNATLAMHAANERKAEAGRQALAAAERDHAGSAVDAARRDREQALQSLSRLRASVNELRAALTRMGPAPRVSPVVRPIARAEPEPEPEGDDAGRPIPGRRVRVPQRLAADEVMARLRETAARTDLPTAEVPEPPAPPAPTPVEDESPLARWARANRDEGRDEAASVPPLGARRPPPRVAPSSTPAPEDEDHAARLRRWLRSSKD